MLHYLLFYRVIFLAVVCFWGAVGRALLLCFMYMLVCIASALFYVDACMCASALYCVDAGM